MGKFAIIFLLKNLLQKQLPVAYSSKSRKPAQRVRAGVGERRESVNWLLKSTVKRVLVFVAFPTSRFQVEHQVLHIQSQLTEGFLDQVQYASASFGVLDNAIQ